MMSLLPATTYDAPPRQGRGRQLKTIVEAEECIFTLRSDSEGDDSDKTIIARPVGLDAKLAAGSTTRSKLSRPSNNAAPSPIASSPCSSIEDDSQRGSIRRSYAESESDAGTVFSEESCPSLTGSNTTTFYTNSSRNSVSSSISARSSRNRYPSILIPRGSWHEANSIKEVTFGMSPAQKILLSPQALSALPQNVPSLNAPPSFGEGSSIASNSPGITAASSAPITPELQDLVPVQGEAWGAATNDEVSMNIPIEIAVDDEHSIIVSPHEVRSQADRSSNGYSTDWSDMVVRFPTIPGATPQENTPVESSLDELRGYGRAIPSDHGVQLPNDALSLLQNLTRSYSPDSESRQSGTSRARTEMKECIGTENRPKSVVAATPTLSDYSFSQLSIPSPGGFFSSLQASSRATWCFKTPVRNLSLPSSAMAENFYDVPFRSTDQTFETIIELPDRELTDGPPTARQAEFAIPAEYHEVVDMDEDDDLYGADLAVANTSPKIRYEYEVTYDDDLKHAGEANIDRTSDWLSAQTSYLSALRESNPKNDPADYIPQTPHPLHDHHNEDFENSAKKAVRFLEEAMKVSDASFGSIKKTLNEPLLKEPVFLQAFEHFASRNNRLDVFLQASTRLESVNSSRLAQPVRHIHSLLNTHTIDTLQIHIRPKYRGPFGQNPRATGNFHKTPEQEMFAEAERKQLAIDHILPTVWAAEAQRKVFHRGSLLACPAAIERLAKRSKTNMRVLDLAGAATGSWAWSAARKWSHVKVVTVQTKSQAQASFHCPLSKKVHSVTVKPENPSNHKVITVPELWKLPFRDNHFDVISARTLHMFLRSRPVPEVSSINEWDLTLKECMRILKPGGVLDFIILDSHIANNSSDNRSKHGRGDSSETGASISPTAALGQSLSSPPPTATFAASSTLLNPEALNFGRELKKRGFEADGGCSKLAERLQKAGFTETRRQWVGLPLGRTGPTHDNVLASYERFEASSAAQVESASKTRSQQASLQRSKVGSVSHANGRSRTPFPPAPRPISEVSSISRIIEQYSNVEAVHGPVGSTAEVSDMAGLLGTLMWEEWLVRHRLDVLNAKNRESGQQDATDATDVTFEATNLLYGINDILAAGYAKGACFRGIVGWAKKPGKTVSGGRVRESITQQQMVQRPIHIETQTDTYRSRAAQLVKLDPRFVGFPSDVTPTTATTANTATPSIYQYYGRGFTVQTPIDQVKRDLSLDTKGVGIGSHGSPQQYYTESAVERGEVGTIPMMIVE